MTDDTEARIQTAELARVALICPQCAAETTVNLREAKQARAWEEGRALICGVCQLSFDGDVKRALHSLREGLTLLDGPKVTATFRITKPTARG